MNAHGLIEGDRITFSEGRPRWWRVIRLIRWWLRKRRPPTVYYVRGVDGNTFQLSTKAP